MYAVIETGSKQYKVAKDDIILVERLEAKDGKTLSLRDVLLIKEGNSVHVGSPYLKGARVTCEVLAEVRGDKLIAYKYKKRKSEKKKIGHRQNLLKLKIKSIELKEG
ncbi:MAG: 50S ribosomal protein L21 [Candidatus Omnitrophota bacterium]|jgi:large subunit ribosomal protein L21|nr:50S ribosomal protein L21 [Candidatus Omnitrophota bacterium]